MKTKIKSPSPFIYYVLLALPILFFKIKLGAKVKREKLRKGSLILAPHRSYYDIVTCPLAVYPDRMHFVSSSYWYRTKALIPLLNSVGTIPRDQYKNDIKSIKKMVEAIKAGHNVLIFPEGQMSTYGVPLTQPEGLEKFIKKYKPNVYYIHNHGGYLASPKWAKGPGLSKIELENELFIKSEEIDNLTTEEIALRIKNIFNDGNDFDWLKERPKYKFIKKKKAEGLENAVMHCPKCGSELSLYTKNSHIGCKECDLSLDFEKNNYDFKSNNVVPDLKTLFSNDLNKFKETCNNNLILEDDAEIYYYEGYKCFPLFKGKVIMDKDKFTLESNDYDPITIEHHKIINLVITLNKSFEIPTPERTYRIYTKNPKKVILYWNYFQNIKE